MKYNYSPLTGICKEAIEKGLCLGCNRLEELSFRGIKECELIKENWVQEKINYERIAN